jgi:hypothetical protein
VKSVWGRSPHTCFTILLRIIVPQTTSGHDFCRISQYVYIYIDILCCISWPTWVSGRLQDCPSGCAVFFQGLPRSRLSYRCVRRNRRAKPYIFIGIGAMDVTKPYKFAWFGDIHGLKPYEFTGSRAAIISPTPVSHSLKVPDRRNTPKSAHNRSELLCADLWAPCRIFWAWFGHGFKPKSGSKSQISGRILNWVRLMGGFHILVFWGSNRTWSRNGVRIGLPG